MPHADLTVADFMTSRAIVVVASDRVEQAEQAMRDSDIRHLPVVDDQGRIIGILSQHDLSQSGDKELPVSKFMTEDVLMVRPETRACEATALMLDRKIRALPVVDREMHVVGVVTETDFLRLAHSVLGGDALGP